MLQIGMLQNFYSISHGIKPVFAVINFVRIYGSTYCRINGITGSGSEHLDRSKFQCNLK